MRVYLPADVTAVRSLVDAGTVRILVAHAVTDDLRAAVPDADDEELEYRALLAAAADSAARVADAAPGPGAGLRVVVAADVETAEVPGPASASGTAVRLLDEVPYTDVAAVHVDESAAGDPDDRDLLWYAPQELVDWLAGLG